MNFQILIKWERVYRIPYTRTQTYHYITQNAETRKGFLLLLFFFVLFCFVFVFVLFCFVLFFVFVLFCFFEWALTARMVYRCLRGSKTQNQSFFFFFFFKEKGTLSRVLSNVRVTYLMFYSAEIILLELFQKAGIIHDFEILYIHFRSTHKIIILL